MCMWSSVLLMGGEQGGDPIFFIMMGLLFVVMYFFMIRPQQKKAKEQKNFLAELKKGDKIVTAGGIHGRILKVDDDSFLIEVDTNTKLRIDKSVISLDFTKAATEGSNGKSDNKGEKDKDVEKGEKPKK